MKTEPSIFGTAMIVDDSRTDILLIKQLVLNLNVAANIISFENPREAFTYIKNIVSNELKEGLPDIIFLDLNMPEMSGFQFLDLLSKLPKKKFEDCKVIIVSSSDAIEDIKKSAEYLNVIKYFFKPLSKMDVTEILGVKKYN